VGAALLGFNKGGGPRFLPRQDEIDRMLAPFDLAGRSCFGGLRQRTPLDDPCLEIDGSGDPRSCAPMFFLTVWVQRERFKALQAVNTMEHAFSFHGASGECHCRQDLWASNGGFCLCGDEELARCSMTSSSGMQVGATAQEKSKVLFFRMKIQGLALIGCAWQWPC
jgi:hypothetical protein